jgi:hypothetical protein
MISLAAVGTSNIFISADTERMSGRVQTSTTQGMWVASGTAQANPGNGPGGLPQYFIPGVKNDPSGTGRVDPADPRFTRVGEIPLGP